MDDNTVVMDDSTRKELRHFTTQSSPVRNTETFYILCFNNNSTTFEAPVYLTEEIYV